ncbi:MAG: hypothetical protein KKE50_06070, partial [Nanoarchaeota archaeon]|nr:hypothetical protein [Nanoarchaeota archaeon]
SSNNNQLTNITANSNYYGILISWISNNNTLTNITANSNNRIGIYLGLNSNNLVVQSSTACDNTQKDVYCQSASSVISGSGNNSGSGNKFTTVQACSDNNWPSLSDYSGC